MAHRYLKTKLQPPVLRPSRVVPRPRLINLLNQAQFGSVTLVSAPAGFGKTTLVADWVGTLDEASCWYSIDQRDNDPQKFLGYLITAIQSVRSDFGSDLLPMVEAPELPDPGDFTTALINELAESDEQATVILDDLQMLENREINLALTLLIDHLPPRVRLVILTREDPSLPLSRLRGSGRLTELRAGDLSFSLEETRTFTNELMQLQLNTDVIGKLEERTEGWIAGLQMAALSLVDRSDPEDFVRSLAGTNRFILDYLIDEVLAHQSQTVRDFLLATSILETINGSLCDAVTGRSDGQEMLESLDRGNMLLVPLDDRREWYRYHQLFADVMQAQATRERPGELTEWHRRACGWYDRMGDRTIAIAHAFASHDQEMTAGLIERTWPELTYGVRPMTWLGWAEQLPPSLVESRPVLCAASAWMLLDKGEIDRADFRLGVVESLFDQTAAAGETPGVPVSNHQEYSTLRGSTEAARAYLCLLRDEYPTAIEHAESALTMLPPDADFWHGTANLFLGLAHWWNGNLPGAFRAIESSVLHQHRCRNFFYHAFGMVLLAEIRTVQGRLIEAQEQFDRIIGDSASTDDWNRGKRSELIQDPVALYTGLGELHRLRGELDWAERYLSRGTDIRYQAILPATTYRLYTLRARLHESRHNYQNALADLDTAERLLAPGAVPDVFQIGPLKARIRLRLGRHREALEWAENHPIGTIEGPVPYRDIFSRLTWIRVMVEHAMETRDDAGMTTLLSVLDNFVERLLPVGFTTMTIEALLLQASILDRHGEVEAAVFSVERAAELSEPESIIQPFLDEGMVLFRPLKHALSRGKQTVFLKTVLTALQGDGSKESPPAAAANHLLIEPLSPRELEVLHLVASGQTNQEIGDSLYISLSTVKKHLNNLYGKMSVKNRTESLHRARELGLI